MILGTARRWWIVTGLLFVLGLVLVGGDMGGTLGKVAGVLCIILAMLVFAVAPMRYGRPARTPTSQSPTPAEVTPPIVANAQPRPRSQIQARDSSEV